MKTGQYTAKIEARRAKMLAMKKTGIVEPTPDYSTLFTDAKEAIEDRVEQEILDRFGGYDAMVDTFEAELAGEKSMTAAEAIAYLRSLGSGIESD